MITISAFRWVPPFAQGIVRDLRVRWALEEAGIPYRTRLLEQDEKGTAAYRQMQPFGQVPYLQDGDFVMFETGAPWTFSVPLPMYRQTKLPPVSGTERPRMT